MGHQMDKAGLWAMIRKQHPEFAQALKASKSMGDANVAVNGYPKRTEQWLMNALERENVALATLLKEEILPAMEVFAAIGEPVASVAIDELITALLAFEGRQEAA
jgi:hypothetical protein